MKLNTYTLVARMFPAMLNIVPFFLFYYFYLRVITAERFLHELFSLQILSDVTFALILLYLSAQIGRILSKEIFEKRLFKNGNAFPTTNWLLHENLEYSKEFTDSLHKKVFIDFGILIPSLDEQVVDQNRSLKICKEAAGMIRLKVGSGRLVDQHNMEYGFVRNLIGGSVLGFVISLLDIIFFGWVQPNILAICIGAVVMFSYLLVVMTGRWLMKVSGTNYARVLFQEYMSIK